jgi:hypothetical protein
VFRVKDLVITVIPKVSEVPELQRCLLGTHICIRPTVLCRQFSCNYLTCGYLSCGFVSPCNWQSITACWQFISCQLLTNPCGQFISPPCPLRSVDCQFGTRPGCPAGSIFQDDLTTVINPQVLVVNEVADIKMLRQELDEVQRRLGEFEQKGFDVEAQTPEELEQLEGKLKEALEEIQAKRKQGGKK